MTIQAAHDQILVDMLDELCALQANLAHLRRSPSPPPLMMVLLHSVTKRGEYI